MPKLKFAVIEEQEMNSLFKGIRDINRKLDEIQSNEESSRLFSNEEFCDLIGISKRTALNLRNRREINYIQYAHKIWYKKEDIDAFLDSHYIKGKDNN